MAKVKQEMEQELILELHSNGTKVAELPLSAMASWTPRQAEAFIMIQMSMGRTGVLRYEENGDALRSGKDASDE